MYSGYYDPRYMQGDPFGMGYAAEIQSYNQEYAKQMQVKYCLNKLKKCKLHIV